MANLHRDLAGHSEAEQLYTRAIVIWERALGPLHPELAKALGGLGGLYLAQGKYAQVKLFYRRGLAIREKALGREHSEVAAIRRIVSSCYGKRIE